MDKRLFIIEAMVLFQNKRLQGNLKTLHPITCNIDKHKDCAGLGVGSALTPRLNPTLHQTPTLCSFCPFFQNDASKSVKKQPCRAKEGEQGIRMKSGELVNLIRREYPSIKDNHSTKIHLGMAMKELGFEGKTHGNQTYYKVIPLKAA